MRPYNDSMPGTGGDAMWGTAFGVGSALALLLVAWSAARAARAREQRRQQDPLRQARDDAALYRRLARGRGGWSWRTDAQLVVRQLEGDLPPAAAAWLGTSLTSLLADAQGAEPPGIAGLLDTRAAIDRLPVLVAGLGGTPQHELAATAVTASDGSFVGYVGVVRPASELHHHTSATNEDALSFSYTLSHDLRAPVRVVEGFARIVKEDYGGSLDRIGNDHLDRVLAAAARMNQMIDALLAMARLATQPLQRQAVDLTQLAGYVVDELRRGAPERQITIEIEPGLRVQGDPTLLRQVLENLLGNAWKYTQRQAEPQVRFGREIVDGRTTYVVRDNGAGFDMRSVDRLFGLFQRLHSASEFPGTGVGLASVKRIVARHGGRIWAEAEPGRGAAFYFTLRD
ncbi:MAG: hypothetical protein JNN18_17590 [Rubrivivax sp.]|nr:hypothetical protein [Rubrivivax sp.]